jgi:branched-chain amino acid transport system permease protein
MGQATYLADAAVQILFIVGLTAALNLLMGTAGQLSMATAGFYAVGAYTYSMFSGSGESLLGTKIVGLGWPVLVSLVAALAVTALFGVLVSLPALQRVRGDYVVLLTLAFYYLVISSIGSFQSVTGGTTGTVVPGVDVGGYDFSSPTTALLPVLVLVVVVVGLMRYLARSPYGRVLRGMRDDQEAVHGLGRYTAANSALAFGMTAGIMGLLGGVSGAYVQFVAPTTYTFDLSVLVAAAVALGGPGNVAGGALAAVVIAGLTPLLENMGGMSSEAAAPWRGVIYGLVLIVGIRFRPRGLLPENIVSRRTRNRDQDLVETISGAGRLPVTSRSSVTAEPVVTVRGLSKQFGGLKAVSNVSFNLTPGRITALIGPNGAGKTTIFNMLTGTFRPDAGEILVRGRNVVGLSTQAIVQAGVARYHQSVRLFPSLTTYENVALGLPAGIGDKAWQTVLRPIATMRTERARKRRVIEILASLGIADRLDERAENLSYGDQKVVALARLLATDCDILLLDEPTSGVDPVTAERLIALVKELAAAGKAVCIVEHSVHVVSELSDDVVFLEHGEVIAEGSIEDIMGRQDLVERYFGT